MLGHYREFRLVFSVAIAGLLARPPLRQRGYFSGQSMLLTAAT
jgi:hypothetical protein